MGARYRGGGGLTRSGGPPSTGSVSPCRRYRGWVPIDMVNGPIPVVDMSSDPVLMYMLDGLCTRDVQ